MEQTKDIMVKVLQMKCREMINYTYLLIHKSKKEAYIIDPSWELQKILDQVEEYQIAVKGILLTHYHYDHVNLVDELVKLYDCDVFIGLDEINYYGISFKNMRPLFDMGRLYIGNNEIVCIQTPGHTKGGMCFLVGDVMFTGDTLFMEGCGACDMRGGSAAEMYDSLIKLKKSVSQYTQIYSGHAFSLEVGEPYWKVFENNIYLQLTDKEKFIQFRMRKNITQLKFK